MYTTLYFVNRNSLSILSFVDFLNLFFFLIAVVRNSCATWTGNSEDKYSFLPPHLKANHPVFYHQMFTVGFSLISFIILKKFHVLLVCWIFLWWRNIFVKCFLCLLGWLCSSYVQVVLIIVYNINWFLNVSQSWIFGINLHLIKLYKSFYIW